MQQRSATSCNLRRRRTRVRCPRSLLLLLLLQHSQLPRHLAQLLVALRVHQLAPISFSCMRSIPHSDYDDSTALASVKASAKEGHDAYWRTLYWTKEPVKDGRRWRWVHLKADLIADMLFQMQSADDKPGAAPSSCMLSFSAFSWWIASMNLSLASLNCSLCSSYGKTCKSVKVSISKRAHHC